MFFPVFYQQPWRKGGLFSLHSFLGLFLITTTLLFPAPSRARDYIDVTADVRKIPTAVPYFLDEKSNNPKTTVGKELSELLANSLDFHGFIKVLPPAMFDGRIEGDWGAAGAELLVNGRYRHEANDEITLELRLVDLLAGEMLLGRRYSGPWNNRRQIVLKFADEVIGKLSGEKGISLSRIAFVSDKTGYKEIYVSDPLGDNIRQITKHNHLAISPRFTPDGTKLFYSSYHRGRQILYLTDLTQSSQTRAMSWREGLNLGPAVAPDGRSLILSLNTGSDTDLYQTIADAPNGDQLKIINHLTKFSGINVSPTWSPDGTRIAFVSDRGGSPQIYIMDMGTLNVRRLTFSGNYNTSPSWSPKGDLIAYAGLTEGTYHIFTISPDGGVPMKLTKTWGSHESPSWAPDGRQLVFHRKRDEKQEICAIFKSGGDLRILFKDMGHQSLPQWSARLDF